MPESDFLITSLKSLQIIHKLQLQMRHGRVEPKVSLCVSWVTCQRAELFDLLARDCVQ